MRIQFARGVSLGAGAGTVVASGYLSVAVAIALYAQQGVATSLGGDVRITDVGVQVDLPYTSHFIAFALSPVFALLLSHVCIAPPPWWKITLVPWPSLLFLLTVTSALGPTQPSLVVMIGSLAGGHAIFGALLGFAVHGIRGAVLLGTGCPTLYACSAVVALAASIWPVRPIVTYFTVFAPGQVINHVAYVAVSQFLTWVLFGTGMGIAVCLMEGRSSGKGFPATEAADSAKRPIGVVHLIITRVGVPVLVASFVTMVGGAIGLIAGWLVNLVAGPESMQTVLTEKDLAPQEAIAAVAGAVVGAILGCGAAIAAMKGGFGYGVSRLQGCSWSGAVKRGGALGAIQGAPVGSCLGASSGLILALILKNHVKNGQVWSSPHLVADLFLLTIGAGAGACLGALLGSMVGLYRFSSQYRLSTAAELSPSSFAAVQTRSLVSWVVCPLSGAVIGGSVFAVLGTLLAAIARSSTSPSILIGLEGGALYYGTLGLYAAILLRLPGTCSESLQDDRAGTIPSFRRVARLGEVAGMASTIFGAVLGWELFLPSGLRCGF